LAIVLSVLRFTGSDYPFGIFKLFFDWQFKIYFSPGLWLSRVSFRVMVFNATFNNISAILWPSVLLAEETGVPRENTDLSQVTNKLYHIMLYPSISPFAGFELTTLVMICTDYTGSYKSNYHETTTMAALPLLSIVHC
jgi:hypothetical protein